MNKGSNLKGVRVFTTEAPSPRTALRAKSGTGSHDGRPRTFPNFSHISANLTGCGAVPLITPDIQVIETEFNQWTVIYLCLPAETNIWSSVKSRLVDKQQQMIWDDVKYEMFCKHGSKVAICVGMDRPITFQYWIVKAISCVSMKAQMKGLRCWTPNRKLNKKKFRLSSHIGVSFERSPKYYLCKMDWIKLHIWGSLCRPNGSMKTCRKREVLKPCSP